jgi:hypothetical protein
VELFLRRGDFLVRHYAELAAVGDHRDREPVVGPGAGSGLPTVPDNTDFWKIGE